MSENHELTGILIDNDDNSDSANDNVDLKRNFYKIIRHITYYLRQRKWKQFHDVFIKLTNILTQQQLIEFKSSDYKTNRSICECYERKFLKILYEKGYEIFKNSYIDLLFCYAANLDVDSLKDILIVIKRNYKIELEYIDYISQTRECYTVLSFTQKFANFYDKQFINCLKILIESGVNLNRCNYLKRLPLDEICFRYEQQQKAGKNLEDLKDLAQSMIDNGACCEQTFIGERNYEILVNMGINLVKSHEIDQQSKLFTFIITNNKQDLVNLRKFRNNLNDGEHTLMQLAVKLNHHEIVDYLLKIGDNPNLTTNLTKTTPLQLAAYSNYTQLFQLLLNHKNTAITEDEYNEFIRERGKKLKTIYIKALLESKKLDVNYKTTTTLNTPLHYAIIFSYNKAIQQLLKRGAPLNRTNSTGRTCLDLIYSRTFEDFLDDCLITDRYYDATHKDYKMQLNFNCFIDKNESNELELIYKIGKIESLQYLLPHPLIHSFLLLKWYRSKIYFYFITIVQTMILLLLGINFYYYQTDHFPTIQVVLFIINVLLKLVFIILNLILLKTTTLLCKLEILLMLTMIAVFSTKEPLQQQFRAFVLIELSICFMLTISDHYKLTKWSIMIQTVIKTFLSLTLYFLIPIIGYSAAFNILLINNDVFATLPSSFLKVFGMLSGELDLGDLITNSFGIFVFLLLFIVTMTMILNNFWTGVAVSDIDKIQRNSEINVFINLITFLRFIDHFYCFCMKYSNFFTTKLRNPFIFLNNNGDDNSNNSCRFYKIDFYINQEIQFQSKQTDKREIQHLPKRLNEECFDKIKQLRSNRSELTKADIQLIKEFCNLQKKLANLPDDSLDNLVST